MFFFFALFMNNDVFKPVWFLCVSTRCPDLPSQKDIIRDAPAEKQYKWFQLFESDRSPRRDR